MASVRTSFFLSLTFTATVQTSRLWSHSCRNMTLIMAKKKGNGNSYAQLREDKYASAPLFACGVHPLRSHLGRICKESAVVDVDDLQDTTIQKLARRKNETGPLSFSLFRFEHGIVHHSISREDEAAKAKVQPNNTNNTTGVQASPTRPSYGFQPDPCGAGCRDRPGCLAACSCFSVTSCAKDSTGGFAVVNDFGHRSRKFTTSVHSRSRSFHGRSRRYPRQQSGSRECI